MAERQDTTKKHPSYAKMVEDAIFMLKDRQGSSRQAIASYVAERYGLDPANCTQYVNKSLKAGLESNVVLSSTDNLMGKFKLPQAKKDELKKLQKKVEVQSEKAEGGAEKKLGKPAKRPVTKKSSDTRDDKENAPSAKAKKVKDKSDSKADKASAKGKKDKGDTKQGSDSSKGETSNGQKGKVASAKSKTMNKSASTSKVDQAKSRDKQAVEAERTRGRKRAADTNDIKEVAEKKATGRKGSRKASEE